MRGAGPPEREPVQRRVRLHVEAGSRVHDAVARARPLLQLAVVRRHDGQPRLAGEPFEERLRERRAFLRIRAGGDLVQQHQRPFGRRREDRDERPDVAGERREAHLDRLAVADVGEHLVEHRQRRLGSRRAKTALMEQRRQAERLQRNRLAARVRTADHERAELTEVEIDRNRRRAVEQRMTRADESHHVGHLHFGAVPTPRQRTAGNSEVELAHCNHERAEGLTARSDVGGELTQDPLRLFARVRRCFGELVPELDDRQRLDEYRLARSRRVVDDPRHLIARRRAHRKHRASSPLGEERFLKRVAHTGGPRDPRELVAQARVAVPQLAAQLAQLRRRLVAQVGAVVLDATVDCVREANERRLDALGDRGEERHSVAPAVHDAARIDCDARGHRHGAQIGGRENTVALCPLDEPRDVGDARERRVVGAVEQLDRLRGQRLPCSDLVCVGGGNERTRQPRAEVGGGCRR